MAADCGERNVEEIMNTPESITGQYLSGRMKIPVPETRRKPTGWLTVSSAQENNLKKIDVRFPLGRVYLRDRRFRFRQSVAGQRDSL